MASVKSPIRRLLKPLLFKLLGERGYFWFQYYGKLRDIKKRLVEEPEMALLPRFLANDAVSLDIGANYAYYTVRMAELSPAGRVYAFEPIPLTFEICRKIVEHYELKNVELFQKGVGARNERVQFEVPLQESGSISAGQAHIKGRNNEMAGKERYHAFDKHRTFECEIVALDKTLGHLERLDFVKIDIEGAELFALEGMSGLLERFKPVILIEIVSFFLKGFGISEQKLADFFERAGYETFRYDPTTRKLARAALPFSDSNYVLLHRERLQGFEKKGFIA